MPLLVTLGEVRDVVIIVWGIIGALFFAVALIVALIAAFGLRGGIGANKQSERSSTSR